MSIEADSSEPEDSRRLGAICGAFVAVLTQGIGICDMSTRRAELVLSPLACLLLNQAAETAPDRAGQGHLRRPKTTLAIFEPHKAADKQLLADRGEDQGARQPVAQSTTTPDSQVIRVV